MEPRKPILINDLALYRQRSGVGWYVASLLAHLSSVDASFVPVPLSRTWLGRPLSALSSVYEASRRWGGATKERATSRSLLGRGASEIVRLVRKFGHPALDGYLRAAGRSGRWAVYHEPDALPLAIDVPTITTIHDLSVLLFPHWHPSHRVARYERKLKGGLDRSARVLVDAHSTKSDLVDRLGVAPEQVDVIPLAPRPVFHPLDAEIVAAVRRRLGLPERYLLYVGTIEPRKNVAGLLRSYALLPDATRSAVPLVLVGGWGWRSGDVQAMLEQPPWNTSVRWLGYLSDDDLVAVTNGASALVYPSFYEGFGLPPIEAMACGRPVISSHAGSLREVVGDAALVIDPSDESAVARAMLDVLSEPQLARDLSERGLRQSARFDWRRTATATMDAYRRVA